MEETDICLRKMRERIEIADSAAQEEEWRMRYVDIWTIQGDHLVFRDILLAGPTEGERFFFVRRNDRTDYIPARDILRATVTDEKWTVNRNLNDKVHSKKKYKNSRSKQVS